MFALNDLVANGHIKISAKSFSELDKVIYVSERIPGPRCGERVRGYVCDKDIPDDLFADKVTVFELKKNKTKLEL